MQFTDAPIFDTDQHMYVRTADALTKYLPEKYAQAVQFGQFGRQTRIVIVNGRVSDFIPNPTFDGSRLPGRTRSSSPGEHRGPDAARRCRPSIEALAATRTPEDRVKELDRQGVVEAINCRRWPAWSNTPPPTTPELTLAIIHALNQWMAGTLEFQLPEPGVRLTRIIGWFEGDASAAQTGIRSGTGRQGRTHQPGPVNGCAVGAPRPPRVRPVLG